ncbi:MAG: nucleotide sugar dehydrogenase, partial [Ilumatobacteraceae bacterium]
MASRIAIIGTGYVGLTTGACFAHIGHEVICADIDPGRVERLSRGILPIYEPGLQEIVEEGIANGRLRFVVGAAEAAADCEFAYLCVQTPQGDDGSADLTYLQAAAAEIAHVLPANSIVVNKSTVPVGSTKVVERVLGRHDVSVVSNPEFLREGAAVSDWLKPDRVVIGSDDPSAATRVAELYDATSGHVIITDPASAETIKYAANAFLATKISFVNAVAAVCEAVGADVNDVVLGIGYDKRIGHEFLKPGPGWGGSCFDGAETIQIRIEDDVRVIPFSQLGDSWTAANGAMEALSWRPDAPRPEFERIIGISDREYVGDMIHLRTKMGRRLFVTADHPMVARIDGHEPEVVLAGDLTEQHWLPLAIGDPLHKGLAPRWMGDVALDEQSWKSIGSAITDDNHRIPDLAWTAAEDERQALLRGLWSGDGSWSYVDGGPSVVLEYGTVSRELADGMVRMFATLGIVARLKVGR